MSEELKEKVVGSALEELLDYARGLAYFDERRNVAGKDDTFRKLQTLSQLLTGLQQAVKRYDDTIECFEKESK